jgi:methyltransferase (TIGR00027 family)
VTAAVPTGPEPLSGVSATALGVARARAGESRRPDRLFDDPMAARFLAAAAGEAGEVAAADDECGDEDRLDSYRAALGFHVVIRTRFYDDYLLAACAASCRQVVLLAAGLDARAFRLPWPAGVRVFEVDLAAVLDVKAAALRAAAPPRCERTVVAADLRTDWSAALVGAGYDATRPTAWLVEGLLVYLDRGDAGHVLATVDALSCAGSRLATERGTSAARLPVAGTPAWNTTTAMWQGGLGDDTGGWLERHGWRVRDHDLGAVAAGYGRALRSRSRSGFLTATRA